MAASMTTARSTARGSIRILPLMMRETSSRSSINWDCTRALRSIVSRPRAKSALPSLLFFRMWLQPRIADNGVLNSCESVARNSSLVRFANSDLARGLETIERNARVQSQLIDDLLDVSRIISGKIRIEPRAVDLAVVIEAAIDSVRPTFDAKEIQFETDVEARDCKVLGDANRLQQIFWNLFSNAVKFTPERGKVRVQVREQDFGVKVSVIDTGVGITLELLPYILERF